MDLLESFHILGFDRMLVDFHVFELFIVLFLGPEDFGVLEILFPELEVDRILPDEVVVEVGEAVERVDEVLGGYLRKKVLSFSS